MTQAIEVPSLPLEQDVHWRHALAYVAPTPEEAYQAGQFAAHLGHAIERWEHRTGRPSTSVKAQIAQAHAQGYAAGIEMGRKEAPATPCVCQRCVEYSDEQLRSLGGGALSVGPLTLHPDGHVLPVEEDRCMHYTQQAMLVTLMRAFPSYAGFESLVEVGRDPTNQGDRHHVRVRASRLRAVLVPYGIGLETMPGRGYRLIYPMREEG